MNPALERLAFKYRTLAALRVRREELEGAGCSGFSPEEGAERRRIFRRIAREFPGALRELDESDAARLQRRADELEAALAGGSVPSWAALVIDYHALLRDALAVKRWIAVRLPRRGPIPPELVAAFRGRLERIERLRSRTGARPSDRAAARRHDEYAELLARHHAPPGGRILSLVWEALEARHGLQREELERRIFRG